jgi:HEAT repeat protein
MTKTTIGFRVARRLGRLPGAVAQFGRQCAGQAIAFALSPVCKRSSLSLRTVGSTADAPQHDQQHTDVQAEALDAEPTSLHPEAADALIAQLRAASSWRVRASAALSLRDVKAEGVLPALARALRDRSVDVAAAAAHALSYRGEAAAERALLAVLENTDETISPVIRLAVANALARLNALHVSVVDALTVRETDALVAPVHSQRPKEMERERVRASDLTEAVQPSP